MPLELNLACYCKRRSQNFAPIWLPHWPTWIVISSRGIFLCSNYKIIKTESKWRELATNLLANFVLEMLLYIAIQLKFFIFYGKFATVKKAEQSEQFLFFFLRLTVSDLYQRVEDPLVHSVSVMLLPETTVLFFQHKSQFSDALVDFHGRQKTISFV